MPQTPDRGGRKPEGNSSRQPLVAAAKPRRVWLAVIAGSLFACLAGLLWARLHRTLDRYFPPASSAREMAALPLPRVAPDLHPEYRALLDEAGGVAQQVVELFPADPQAVAALALLHNLAHDEAGEVACWERCLELDPEYLLAYSNLATRAVNKGDHQRAETLLRGALRVPNAAPDFADLLASTLMDLGRLQEAVQVLEDSLSRQPGTPGRHAALGELYLQLKEYAEAKKHFEQTLQMDDSSSRAYHGLMQVSSRLGAAEEAEHCREEFTRLRKLEEQAGRQAQHDPTDQQVVPQCVAQLLTMAARVYSSHGHPEAAERHLRRAAELGPDDVPCRVALAELCDAQGRLEDALSIVEELAQIEPQNLVHVKYLGVLQARLARWEAAEKTFEGLCRRAPQRAAGYAGLAESYLRTGKDFARARLLAAKAAELEPSGHHFSILAAICEQQGDLDGARSALSSAIALDPDEPRYRQMYAWIQGKD